MGRPGMRVFAFAIKLLPLFLAVVAVPAQQTAFTHFPAASNGLMFSNAVGAFASWENGYEKMDTNAISRLLLVSERDPGIQRKLYDAHNLLKLGEMKKAFHIIRPLFEKYPENLRVRLSAGVLFYKAGRQDKALNIFLKMLQDAPDDYILHNNLAWVYATSDDPIVNSPESALLHARTALLRGHHDFNVWSTLADAHVAEKDYIRAAQCERIALTLTVEENVPEAIYLQQKERFEKMHEAALEQAGK